jgi:hypothetical protein
MAAGLVTTGLGTCHLGTTGVQYSTADRVDSDYTQAMILGYTLLICAITIAPPLILWLLWTNDAQTLSQTIQEARR